MAERSKAHAWKACRGATPSRVRTPQPPPQPGTGARRCRAYCSRSHAELRLDGLDAGALSDEQARAGVPKVVETQLRQRGRALVLGQLDHRLVGGTDSRPEDEFDEIGPAQRPTHGDGEHQRVPLLRPADERGGNLLRHRARQPDRARLSPWSCGGTRPSMPPSHCRRGAGSWSWVDFSSGHGRLRTAPVGRWSRSWPRSWGRACVGQRRRRPGRRGARSRRVPRRPGRLNERHPASWKLWLQDLALDGLETSAGDCRGMV